MNRTEGQAVASQPDAPPGCGTAGPHGVSGLLRGVFSAVYRGDFGVSSAAELLRDHLSHLDEKLQLVLAEHEGLGNELLRAYEQLGIVFDVTRRLVAVTDENEVMMVFIESLRGTFDRCCFLKARRSAPEEYRFCLWDVPPGGSDIFAELSDLVRESVAARRVVVREYPGALRQAVACPIFAGAELACALVLARDEQFRAFNSADMLLLDSLSVFCGDILRNLHLVHELRQMSIDMVRALVGTIDQKDVYTSGHSNRVGYYACLLAQELGWSDERLQILEWSALLHDVGKIGIRDEVLKKSGKLTPEEFEHMKEHPVRSSEVVCQVPQLTEAIDGVLYHHEHWDGSGYPDGLAGEEIPLQARIIQIADIFDALTTSRSYRKAFPWQKALSILREEAGVVVDPNLAALFERLTLDWAARDREEFDRLFETNAGRFPAGETNGGGPSGHVTGGRARREKPGQRGD